MNFTFYANSVQGDHAVGNKMKQVVPIFGEGGWGGGLGGNRQREIRQNKWYTQFLRNTLRVGWNQNPYHGRFSSLCPSRDWLHLNDGIDGLLLAGIQ